MTTNNNDVTISLITNLSVTSGQDDHFVLPEGVMTVKDLLEFIGEKIEFDLLKTGGNDIDEDVELIVNGRNVFASSERFQKPLGEGDIVEIYMLTLGGG